MSKISVIRVVGMVGLVTVLAVPGFAQSTVRRALGQSELIATAQGIRPVTFDVTITNVSPQIFSPPIVVVHSDDLALFKPGEPASPELAAEAEDADATGLMSLFDSLQGNGVDSYAMASDNLPPGGSVTLQVTSHGFFRNITAVAMLVTTNDGFMSVTAPLSGLALGGNPFQPDVIRLGAPAWDAGSEANKEDCHFIPGPPCGSHFVPDPDGAEGFVHIHPGIHGIGDLNPAMLDWRNPVAVVSIKRSN